MGDELRTFNGGSNGPTPDFAGVFTLLENRQHQTRGLIFKKTYPVFSFVSLSLPPSLYLVINFHICFVEKPPQGL